MSKFISVVVPVRNVQGYLTECLDSVLEQQSVDAEVVAVDDASTDHSGELIDERAASDERLTALHLPANAGPGPARNAGLERASGEYVWFVDGDDHIVPGALAAVEAALLADKPDVLVVGVARERWNRSVARWTTPVVEPAGVAALARSLPPLGALVVRRSFLAEAGIEFGPGWYEDVSFVASVLARTERVSAFEPAVYVYRADRAGSIRTKRSARQADLVDQLDRMLSLTSTATPKIRRQALNRSIDRVLRLMRDEKRLPAGARKDVFGKLSALVRTHQIGDAGLRQRLIAAGSFPAYRLISGTRDGLASIARRGRGFVRARRTRLRKHALGWYYKSQLRRPLDGNLAVYAAYWYRGYACNPAAIYEKAKELAPSVRGVWVVKPGGSLPEGVPGVVAGSKAYYRAIARAKYLINNATFPPEVVKRPGAVHVQTHHGTPLKTMGLDQPRFPASLGKFNPERMRRDIAKWDFSVTANRHTTLLWDRQFPIKGETLRGRGRGRRGPRGAGHRAGRARDPVRADPPRMARHLHPGARCRRVRRGARGKHPGADARALLLRRRRPSAPAPAGHGRLVLPDGRDADDRVRRADDRLLLDHVRLRGSRPPAGDLRARLGGLQDHPRRHVRPDDRARGHVRPVVRRTGRRVPLGTGRRARSGRISHTVPRAVLLAGGRQRGRAGRAEGVPEWLSSSRA
jgi:CDP-glycerol glycerophosphotransferase